MIFGNNPPDPDAIEVPEPYTDAQAADSEGGRLAVDEEEFDPDDAYEPGDPKRLAF